jgi:excisionase family DNA binding protein
MTASARARSGADSPRLYGSRHPARPTGPPQAAAVPALRVIPHHDAAVEPSEPVSTDPAVRRMAYSPTEVAIALGISRDLVDELIRAGRLRSVKAGHRRLIGLRQIEQFLAGG